MILEALLEVKDIAQLDDGERAELETVLARVDRAASMASWASAEPPTFRLWRHGLVQRVRRSDVAAAILHALEPYHVLIRRADPTIRYVVVHLPAARVISVRQEAIMTAWTEQVTRIVGPDATEAAAWAEYWSAINSDAGSREDTLRWLRGLQDRAAAGSAVAREVIEAVRTRDDTIASLLRLARPLGTIAIHVPGIA